jgi:hypothetical protein
MQFLLVTRIRENSGTGYAVLKSEFLKSGTGYAVLARRGKSGTGYAVLASDENWPDRASLCDGYKLGDLRLVPQPHCLSLSAPALRLGTHTARYLSFRLINFTGNSEGTQGQALQFREHRDMGPPRTCCASHASEGAQVA